MLIEFRKQNHLRCEYCSRVFKNRQNKSRHIVMNSCPEIKKSIASGNMQPFAKKHKVTHESIGVSSEPNTAAPVHKR